MQDNTTNTFDLCFMNYQNDKNNSERISSEFEFLANIQNDKYFYLPSLKSFGG